jgi:hypothetical protein
LQCVECQRVSRDGERGWRAYLTGGDADDPGEVVVFARIAADGSSARPDRLRKSRLGGREPLIPPPTQQVLQLRLLVRPSGSGTHFANPAHPDLFRVVVTPSRPCRRRHGSRLCTAHRFRPSEPPPGESTQQLTVISPWGRSADAGTSAPLRGQHYDLEGLAVALHCPGVFRVPDRPCAGSRPPLKGSPVTANVAQSPRRTSLPPAGRVHRCGNGTLDGAAAGPSAAASCLWIDHSLQTGGFADDQ